ncbi:hypothetical protein ES703_71395 [subsurface metagenome]
MGMQKDSERPTGYQYFNILAEHLGNDLSRIFNGKLVYPRQMEIHLPGDHKHACNFGCYYCQGRLLEQPLVAFEDDALRIIDELRGRIPYFIYGGAYTEPLLNPYLLDFLKLSKKRGSYFGIHTNGSLLLELEKRQSFLSELCRISTPEDYLSISLDAGRAKSHIRTKNLERNWFDDIIEGIRVLTEMRGASRTPVIRLCYLLNKANSSEEELKTTIEIAKEVKAESLRFSIPYDLYGKPFSKVRQYKQAIEVRQNEEYARVLEPLMSRDAERPYIFYFPPEHQDVDKMDFRHCLYGYYQITLGADGYIYKCSSTASPTFKMCRLGKIGTSGIDEMILANQNPDFDPFTCFRAGARCNRMALEINSTWACKNEY